MMAIPTVALEASPAFSLPSVKAARRGRALSRQKMLAKSTLRAISFGILALAILGWEGGARLGLIDTLFTFEATPIGFVLGTAIGAALGLSFWQSRNYAAVMESYLVIFNSPLRVTIGFALAGAITAELISSQFGLGRAILYASNTYDMALVWDAIILLFALTLLHYGAVIRIVTLPLRGVART